MPTAGHVGSRANFADDAETGDAGNDSGLQDTTLDEPVMDTIKRDLKKVWTKMQKVVMPSTQSVTQDELRNWDLWGPLFLCLLLAILLSIDESGLPTGQQHDKPAHVFSTLLLIVWVGSVVVTVNAKLLGGNVSFFQNLCLLGYCIAPLILSTGLCMVLRLSVPDQLYSCGAGPKTTCQGSVCIDTAGVTVNVGARCQGWSDKDTCLGDARCNVVQTGWGNVVPRLTIAVGGMAWSLRSSLGFLSEVVSAQRRALAAYPVCLFFAAITWMILIRTSSG